MTPIERQYRRVQNLLDAQGLLGDDTRVQLRAEVDTVRVVRQWQVGGVTTSFFRGYTTVHLAEMEDALLAARLRADVEQMDRGLVQRSVGVAVTRARALGMGWGDVLQDVAL